MRQAVLSLFCCCSLLSIANAQVAEAPRDVRTAQEAQLVAGPTATATKAGLQISFEVSQPTDVEVAILNGEGRVIRHLAAGLIGKNAPEPFQKESLKQSIVWDRRDDAGNEVTASDLQVRVRIGSQARLDKSIGWNGNSLLGKIVSLKMSPAGELFVLLADPYRGRAELRVLDTNGKYLRTILPYPADTPAERTAPFGHMMIDGRRQPIVFNGQAHAFHPLTAGLREQTMAWHPNGYLIAASAIGTMANHGPPRYLLALHPEGGAPEGIAHLGPKIRRERGFMGGAGEGHSMGLDRLAVSPDGQWIYFVQNFSGSYRFAKELRHGVYRLKWTDKAAETLWVGNDKPGDGDNDFNDPAGIAVDATGRVFVCDRGNNRVKVYAPDAKLLGQFACPQPEQIEIHPKSGAMVVLSKANDRRAKLGKLFHFAPWKNNNTQQLVMQELAGLRSMTIDPTSPEMKLWIVHGGGYRRPDALSPAVITADGFTLGDDINQHDALHYPSFLAADPDRNRVIVFEQLNNFARRGHKAIDLTTGKVTLLNSFGSDLTLDADGNIYVMDRYNANSMSRFDPEFKPLPFPGSDSNKISLQYRAYGPSMGMRGHCVAPNGDIYVRRSPNHALIATVDVFSPDGKLKRSDLVRGAGSADTGIGVDNRGNVYLGMNVKPADKPLPADFVKSIPTEAWRYYRDADKRPQPWSLTYSNPYLAHMGSVFKFGPQGGTIFGNCSPKELAAHPEMHPDKASRQASSYKSAYLKWDVKVDGAEWRYPGVGIIPASFDAFRGDDGCSCMVTQLDADPYGRVYAPSVFYSSVEMIDPAGNRLARIGQYGNADSAGKGSKLPKPAIPFAWPTVCDYCTIDGNLYVSDSVNRRVLVIAFDYTAEGRCPVVAR